MKATINKKIVKNLVSLFYLQLHFTVDVTGFIIIVNYNVQ